MAKPIISAFLLIVHILCILIFCMLPIDYKIEHKAICTIIFYCSTMLLLPLNNIITNCEDKAFRIGIYHSHNLFCMVIGTVYALHYTGLLISDYLTVGVYCAIFLSIFMIIFINLSRHGLLKKWQK